MCSTSRWSRSQETQVIRFAWRLRMALRCRLRAAKRGQSSSSKKHSWIELEAARSVRASVQVAARGGDVAVAKRRLHLGQRGPAVDGVRTVRVAQPVRRY